MAKEADTFVDVLMRRYAKTRPLEDKAAKQMRTTMRRIKKDALALVDRNMAAFRRGGKYIDTPAAIEAARRTANEMEGMLGARLTGSANDLIQRREEAYLQGSADYKAATQRLPAKEKARLAGAFDRVNAGAAVSARRSPVLGIRPTDAFAGIQRAAPRQVQALLSDAILAGKDVRETARELSEAMDMSVAAAERIVRTNMNAAYNDAAKALIDGNPEIFIGYRWESVFDDRTSPVCLMLHGSFWPLGMRPPGPPAHWNCRSIIIGVFRDPTVEDIALSDTRTVKEFKRTGPKTVKTVTRVRPALEQSEKWLRRQPQVVVQDTLGSKIKSDAFLGRGEWEGIGYHPTMTDFVTPNLTLRSNAEFLNRAYNLVDGAADRDSIRKIAKGAAVKLKPLKGSKSVLAKERAEMNKVVFDQPQPAPPATADFDTTTGRFTTERAWRKSMSKEERKSFKDWSNANVASNARKLQLGEQTDPAWEGLARDTLKNMDSAIKRGPVEERVLYRGINVSKKNADKLARANTVKWKPYSSTTTSRDIADEFAAGGDHTNVVFEIRNNHKAVDVRNVVASEYRFEQEALMPPGAKFAVKERYWRRSLGLKYLQIILEPIR